MVVCAIVPTLFVHSLAQPQYQTYQPQYSTYQPQFETVGTNNGQQPGFFSGISQFFSRLFGGGSNSDANIGGIGGNVGIGGYPGGGIGAGGQVGGFGAGGQVGGFGGGPQVYGGAGPQVYGGPQGFAPGAYAGQAGGPGQFNTNGVAGFFNALFGNRPYGYAGNGFEETLVHVNVNNGGYPFYGK